MCVCRDAVKTKSARVCATRYLIFLLVSTSLGYTPVGCVRALLILIIVAHSHRKTEPKSKNDQWLFFCARQCALMFCSPGLVISSHSRSLTSAFRVDSASPPLLTDASISLSRHAEPREELL